MKQTLTLLAVTLAAFSPTLYASPTCVDPASDSDGDGWGWENNQSCVITTTDTHTTDPCIDTDGDGYGWNGSATCIVSSVQTVTPENTTACIDTDGDGYGWNGIESCTVEATATACIDDDADGYGWNGTDTCLVIADALQPPVQPEPEPETTVCIDTAPLNDTWGWNGTQACRLAPVLTPADTSAIAGLYSLEDEEGTAYLSLDNNGFYVLYELYPETNNCFFVIDYNSTPEIEGVQIQPLGDNLYEIYDYYVYDGMLSESTDIYEMFITADGALSVSYDDIGFDESGNEISETIVDILPAVNDVNVSELEPCDLDELVFDNP